MRKSVWKAGVIALLVSFSWVAPSLAGEPAVEKAVSPSPGPTPNYPKYCEGKYVNGSTEAIITVGCPNATDVCVCSNGGVTCGSKSQQVIGMTLVSGSCKQTFAPGSTP
jgi:hypothetical protein